MRAAAILGLGCSPKSLKPFQAEKTVEWQMGMPGAGDHADVILLFGGDGTIHRHLGQLVRLGLSVLVVPAGSGNDFARALGLRRVSDSLAAWRKFCAGAENVRRIDLGVISAAEDAGEYPLTIAQGRSARHEAGRGSASSRYFCCVASVGLDSEVARRANQLPRWLRSRGGYVLSLLPTIFRFAPVRMRIFSTSHVSRSQGSLATPGQRDSSATLMLRSDQPTLLAAFANTPTYGGGMKIAPKAKMDDGLLDVCTVGALDPFKLFCMFPTVYGGGHLKMPEVAYFHAARIRVETEQPLDVYADGEYVCQTPAEIAIRRGELRVVVP
jgi:diacylglycerol kinase (ATP)